MILQKLSDMLFTLFLLSSILLTQLLTSSYALPPNIGDNSMYACVEEQDALGCYGSIHKVTPSGLKKSSLSRARRQIQRRIAFLRGSLQKVTARLAMRLKKLRFLKRELKTCTEYDRPECSTLNHDNTHPSLACSVVGSSSHIAVTDHTLEDHSYIVNGHSCERGDSPVVPIRKSGVTICTGTLIATDVILTAAHCLYEVPCHQLSIRDGYGQIAFAASSTSCRIHPQYSEIDLIPERYDIGLIFLDRQLGDRLRIAPLHLVNDYVPGEEIVFAGFGKNESTSLKELRASMNTLTSVTNFGLRSLYTVGDLSGTTCYGDSGGPVFVNRNGSWFLTGVTSWGTAVNCALPGYEESDISVWSRLSNNMHRAFLRDMIPEL